MLIVQNEIHYDIVIHIIMIFKPYHSLYPTSPPPDLFSISTLMSSILMFNSFAKPWDACLSESRWFCWTWCFLVLSLFLQIKWFYSFSWWINTCGVCVWVGVYMCVCAEFLNSSVATHLSWFHTLAIIHSIIVARRVLHFNYMLTLIHVSSTLEW